MSSPSAPTTLKSATGREFSCPVPINAHNLPPLIPIRDDDLRIRSLTHKSWIIQDLEDENDMDDMGNELACWKALESKGDIALHYYLYRIADKIWPQVTASLLSAIRKTFLSNTVFAELARLYGFPDKIRITPEPSQQHLRHNPTVLADAFEAMVGALDEETVREGRQHVLQEWVAKLFSTDVFPTLVEVGESRNNYLKGRRAITKLKIAKEKQRRLEAARKKDAQRGREFDEGIARFRRSASPDRRGGRAGLPRPPEVSQGERRGLAPRMKGDSNLPDDIGDEMIARANVAKV